MTNLSCNACSCVHNDDNCCCLNGIDVKGSNACECSETCCGSYSYKDGSAKNITASPKLNLQIMCAAHNCVYNNNDACQADHVDISGITAVNADDTVCSTFKSK